MLKVAVIDSNAISRDLLKSVLATGGHEIVGDSNTSPAGLAAMIKLRPQVVCIDIGDANEEGWSRIEMLRHELPKALLFLVSGKVEPAMVEGALQRGVHGFIVKPFNGGTVLATIRNAVIKLARQHRKATAEGETS